MGLSEDALWLWREIHTDGVSKLRDTDTLRRVLGMDRAWSAKRLERAVAELIRERILDRGKRKLLCYPHEGSTAQCGDRGVLVVVSVQIFADEETTADIGDIESSTVDAVLERVRKTGRPRARAYASMRLYWCETDDHDEDWFVVASSAEAAQRFYEDYEGYDPGDATATWVADVPAEAKLKKKYAGQWPSDELLTRCGGEFVNYVPAGDTTDDSIRQAMGVVTKAVRFGERTYVAGDVVANVAGRTRARVH